MNNIGQRFDELKLKPADRKRVKAFIEELVSHIKGTEFRIPTYISPDTLIPGAKFRNRNKGSTEMVVLIRQKYSSTGPGWLLGGLYGNSHEIYNTPLRTDAEMVRFLNEHYEPFE